MLFSEILYIYYRFSGFYIKYLTLLKLLLYKGFIRIIVLLKTKSQFLYLVKNEDKCKMANIKIDDRLKVYAELAQLRYKEGWTRQNLVNWLMDKYKIGMTAAYDYVREMMSQTAETYNKLNEDALADSINFLDQLKQSALKDGDKKLALEISKELNKLQQLHIQKMEIDMKVEQPLFAPPTPPTKNKDDK